MVDAGAFTRIRFENFDAYSLPGTLGFGGKTLSAGVYKWGTGLLIPTDITLRGGRAS